MTYLTVLVQLSSMAMDMVTVMDMATDMAMAITEAMAITAAAEKEKRARWTENKPIESGRWSLRWKKE